MKRSSVIATAVVLAASGLAGCSDDGPGTPGRGDAGADGAVGGAGSPGGGKGGEVVDAAVDTAPPREPVRMFYTDFEAPVPSEVNQADCTVRPTQGYATVGPANNTFARSFLWCPLQKKVVVTLLYLAPHSSIDIAFLLAAIDSLDGAAANGTGDFFSVTLDGKTIFRHSLANAVFIEAATGQITNVPQSYVPAPGAELARRKELGFTPGPYWLDSAYNMAVEPAFKGIPHSSSTATIVFTLSNEASGAFDDDESWALDNIRVTVGDMPRAPSDAGADASTDSGSADAR